MAATMADVSADRQSAPAWTARATLLLLALLALAAALKFSYQSAYAAREPLADAPHGESLIDLDEAHRHFIERADEPFYEPPAYPALLAALDAATPGGRARVRLVQSLLGLVVLAGVFVLAHTRGGDLAGALALLVALACASLTFHESKLLDTTLALAAAVAGCVALDRAVRVGCGRASAAAGALLGLAAIAGVGWLPVALAAGVALLLRWRRAGLIFAAGLALFVVPVLLHDARTGGAARVGFSDGSALLEGNNPNAQGTLSRPPGWPDGLVDARVVEHDRARAAVGHEPTLAEQRAVSVDEALGWIAAHPADAASLLRDKLRLLVSSAELGEDDLLSREQDRLGLLTWARLPFLALLAAGLFGLLLPVCRPRLALLAPLVVLTLVLLATYVTSRSRAPLAPFLAVGAGLAGAWLVQRARGAVAWSSALLPAACAAAPLVLAAALAPPSEPAELHASEATFDLALDDWAARSAEARGDVGAAAAIHAHSVLDHPKDERPAEALSAWLDSQPLARRDEARRAAMAAAPGDTRIARLVLRR